MTTFEQDNFSSGALASFWTNNGATIVSSPIYSANSNYSAKFTANTNVGWDTASNYTTFYQRFYVYFSQLPANGHSDNIVWNWDSNWEDAAYLAIHNNGTNTVWQLGYTSSDTESDSTGTTISASTWYCVEIKVEGGSGGSVQLYVNGTSVLNITNLSMVNVAHTQYGNFNTADSSLIAYMGYYVASDTYIGPITGGTTYNITASADTNSSISPSGTVTVNSGANQAFNISANTGYHITHVNVDSADQGAISTYTFTNVTTTHTISVSSAINTYSIISSADSHSTISPSGTTNVNYGTNQSYTLSANSGYQITHVYVDNADQGAITTYTFTNVQNAHTISVSTSTASNLEVANLTVDGNATINNSLSTNALSTSGNTTIAGSLSANTLSTTGNATIGNTLSTNTLSTTGNAAIGGLLTSGGISNSGNETINGVLTVIGDASSNQFTTNSASIGAISTANLTVSNSTTINGTAPDVLALSPRCLPTMPTNLSGFPSIKFQNIKNTPSDPGVPQGAYYEDASPQSLFLTEMQDMGGTGFIQFLATNYGLWVQKDIETYGAFMTASDPSRGSGGGAIQIGHGFTSTTDDSAIILTDTIGGGSGATATLTVTNGVITMAPVTNQGNNYTFADITVGGTGAVLTPIITSGQIQSVTVVHGGQNYVNSDSVNIKGDGSGAVATLSASNGVITSINFTNHGVNYTTATIIIGGSGARLAPIIRTNKTITGITVFSGGSGYSSSDIVSITNNPHNTLYLRTLTSSANLDLQDLTVHGNLTVQGSSNIGGATLANLPLQLISGALSIFQAAANQNGYLSSTDWNTFNGKIGPNTSPTLSGLTLTGNLALAGTLAFGSGSTLEAGGNTSLRIATSYSTVDIGAQSSGYVHFMSNGGLPFYFNQDVSVNGHCVFYSNSANLCAWTGGTHGIQTNGDFYVNGNATLAGQLNMSSGSTAAYIIWSNSHVLTIGADSASPFAYYIGGVEHYFGALDVGAVFCQNINPIGDSNTVIINGYSTFDGNNIVTGNNGGTGQSTYIKIQGPISNGQTATLYLGDTNNYVQNTFGGNLKLVAYNDIEFHPNHSSTAIAHLYYNGAWDFNSNCGVGSNGAFSTASTVTIGNIPSYSSVAGPLYKSTASGSQGTVCLNVSSKRFKENIRDLADCSWIYNLRPVMFDWKTKTEGSDNTIGLIAEEVSCLCPQLVWLDDEGKPLGVHYEWLGIPLLVEVQKLRREIASLQRQLDTLQSPKLEVN
jgi:Chaperone of endosialidase